MSQAPSIKRASRRVIELDILRGSAILLIIFAHFGSLLVQFNGSLFVVFLLTASWLGKFVGLVLFTFVSGYALQLTYPALDSKTELTRFFKRRFVRIFPLYWIALLVNLVFFSLGSVNGYHIDLPLSALVIHVTAMQVLLSPRFTSLYYLWFVGFIVILYLLYPLLQLFSGSLKALLAVSSATFLAFIGLRLLAGIVDERFFLYYWAFIAGIAISRFSIFPSKLPFRSPSRLPSEMASPKYDRATYCFSLVAVGFAVFLTVVFFRFGFNTIITSKANEDYVLSIMAILFACIIFWFLRLYSSLLRGRTVKLFMFLAFSAYCAYLFNFAFLELSAAISSLFLSGAAQLILIVLTVPVLFLFSYYVQRLYDAAIKKQSRSIKKQSR
jgi:peptidoglycan/LPS O-acetylase OafA/YrhL